MRFGIHLAFDRAHVEMIIEGRDAAAPRSKFAPWPFSAATAVAGNDAAVGGVEEPAVESRRFIISLRQDLPPDLVVVENRDMVKVAAKERLAVV